METWDARIPSLEPWSRLIIVSTRIYWAPSGGQVLASIILVHSHGVCGMQAGQPSAACVGPSGHPPLMPEQVLELHKGADLLDRGQERRPRWDWVVAGKSIGSIGCLLTSLEALQYLNKPR